MLFPPAETVQTKKVRQHACSLDIPSLEWFLRCCTPTNRIHMNTRIIFLYRIILEYRLHSLYIPPCTSFNTSSFVPSQHNQCKHTPNSPPHTTHKTTGFPPPSLSNQFHSISTSKEKKPSIPSQSAWGWSNSPREWSRQARAPLSSPPWPRCPARSPQKR